ncbi:uncharacterized protein LOC6582862 [Drosophila mojavensis]|uniref:Secreted protein n=1 Tax=Drosophila mojavensis TaxID=7230 RepID=B4KZR7_DROMO|nr:uncharacterized protein LOC6582862 [Drosophila mojavensis]EDW19023.1 uncharacterized protein Dmoj_GI11756 [Drosophila mojavensis]
MKTRVLLNVGTCLCVFILSNFCSGETATNGSLSSNERSKRSPIPWLIFPATSPTRIQFIGGIGIPLEDLEYEAVTTGYVLKAEYWLPETPEALRTPTALPINQVPTLGSVGARRHRPMLENFLAGVDDLGKSTKKLFSRTNKVLSSYRWTVYKGLEGLAKRLGYQGRICVLKSICEVAEEPFHFSNGLLAELLHILLTPSASVDKLSEHADNEYYYAEKVGQSGAGCDRVFKECQRSLLQHFSELRDNLDSFIF